MAEKLVWKEENVLFYKYSFSYQAPTPVASFVCVCGLHQEAGWVFAWGERMVFFPIEYLFVSFPVRDAVYTDIWSVIRRSDVAEKPLHLCSVFYCTEPLLVRNITPSYLGNTFPLKFTICVKVWDLLSPNSFPEYRAQLSALFICILNFVIRLKRVLSNL